MTDPYVDAIIASTGISREQLDSTVAEWKHLSFHMETVLADHFNVEELASALEQLATRIARIHPTPETANRSRRYGLFGRPVWKVKLTVPDCAYFRINGDKDMSEGCCGWRLVDNYLDYWMAHEAASGQGTQGLWGYIHLMVPAIGKVEVIGSDGQKVVIAEPLTFNGRQLDEYVEFLEPSTD